MSLMRGLGFSFGIITLAGSSVAHARNYGMAGCGLGSVFISGRDVGAQSSAATTNGTGIQTFGITSGTSNCTPDQQKSAARIKQEYFVTTNLVDLEKEVSRGGGTVVENLGKMMGCSGENMSAFGTVLQENYSVIFAAPGGSAVLETIARVLEKDADLSSQCSNIRA
jgi:hypothetical protein